MTSDLLIGDACLFRDHLNSGLVGETLRTVFVSFYSRMDWAPKVCWDGDALSKSIISERAKFSFRDTLMTWMR